MALVMFEGFNRYDDWDPEIWTLNRRYDPSIGLVDDYVEFGGNTTSGNGLRFNHNDALNNDPAVPAAYARALFPKPQAAPGSGVFNATETEVVYVGFRVGYANMLATDHLGIDTKYWSILSAPSTEICTIELKGSEYQADPYIAPDLTKLTLRFKQSGSTVAEFNIPDTALSISTTFDARKIGTLAYLNNGQCYFEFIFHLTANTVQVFFNGTQLLTPTGATSAALTLSAIAGWTFYSPVRAPGLTVDDFYVVNSNVTDEVTGDNGPNMRLGYKTRVLSPTADSFLPLDPFDPGAYPSGWLNHGTPSKINNNDGDANFISATDPGAVADYSFPETITDSLIGGVRFKAVARADGVFGVGALQLRYRYGQYVPWFDEGAVNIDTPFSLSYYYQTYRTPFYGVNKFHPSGSQMWDPTDFSNDYGKGFGVKYVV